MITFITLINTCAKGNDAENALQLLVNLLLKGGPNVITHSALISACAKGDNAENALQLLADLQ